MSTAPAPNLFVVGAMKAGTTTLHRMLAAHPRVFMSEPKETQYFCREADPERRAWYLGLFADAGGYTYRGESSTDYAKLPDSAGVAERIHAFAPEARILYIMRDPVERTISHYWFNVRETGENRPPLEAVRQEPRYLHYSHYAMQLEPYLELFGPQRVRTLTLEALRADARTEMERLFRWLGLEVQAAERLRAEHANRAPSEIRRVRRDPFGLLPRINAIRHGRAWARMRRFLPPAVRWLGRRLTESRIVPAAVDVAPAIAFVRPILREYTEQLTRMLGRTFPEWSTLYAGDDTSGTTAADRGRDTSG